MKVGDQSPYLPLQEVSPIAGGSWQKQSTEPDWDSIWATSTASYSTTHMDWPQGGSQSPELVSLNHVIFPASSSQQENEPLSRIKSTETCPQEVHLGMCLPLGGLRLLSSDWLNHLISTASLLNSHREVNCSIVSKITDTSRKNSSVPEFYPLRVKNSVLCLYPYSVTHFLRGVHPQALMLSALGETNWEACGARWNLTGP